MFKRDSKQSLRELRQELKKRKSLEVEIMNLTTGEVFYECPKTRYKFNLNKLGARENLELDILTTLANRSRDLFENHSLAIVDFEDDEYTADDLIEYLGLRDIYKGIENTDVDYISEILELDNEDFEEFLRKNGNPDLVKRLAERAIYLYSKRKFDSHTKRRILSKLLGSEDIFDVIDVELDLQDEQSTF